MARFADLFSVNHASFFPFCPSCLSPLLSPFLGTFSPFSPPRNLLCSVEQGTQHRAWRGAFSGWTSPQSSGRKFLPEICVKTGQFVLLIQEPGSKFLQRCYKSGGFRAEAVAPQSNKKDIAVTPAEPRAKTIFVLVDVTDIVLFFCSAEGKGEFGAPGGGRRLFIENPSRGVYRARGGAGGRRGAGSVFAVFGGGGGLNFFFFGGRNSHQVVMVFCAPKESVGSSSAIASPRSSLKHGQRWPIASGGGADHDAEQQ